VAILAFVAVLWLTPYGMSAGGDSAWYVGAARNFADGRGISRPTGGGAVKPLTHFPPFYPLTLASLDVLGLDAIVAARWLGALLFSATVVLVGASIRRATGHRIGGLVGSLLVLISPIFLDVYVWILSEPLYLALLCGGFLLIHEYTTSHDRRLLLAGGAVIGLAYATRYVGLALVGTVIVGVLWRGPAEKRVRLLDAALVTLAGVLPTVAWMARNLLVTGTATNRTIVWHPMSISYLKRPFSVVWGWLLPFEFTYTALYAMIALAVVIASVLVVRRLTVGKRAPRRMQDEAAHPAIAVLHFVHIILYTALLAASLSLLDASTPIDDRTTAPLYLSFLILVVGMGIRAWRSPSRYRLTRPVLAGLLLLVTASYAYQDVGLIGQLRQDAAGFASQRRQGSPTLEALGDLVRETTVYTNEPELVYFVSGSGATMIPIRIDAVTGQLNEEFPAKLGEMRARLLRGEAVLVLFQSIADRPDLASVEEMTAGLRVLKTTSDGQILVGAAFSDG